MVTKEALRTKEGRAQFVKDFEFICKKNPNVKWEEQVAKLREYDWFLKETSIKEKMSLLDRMSNDEQEILTSIWPNFKKWIDAESCITSLDITTKSETETKPETENANTEKKILFPSYFIRIGSYQTIFYQRESIKENRGRKFFDVPRDITIVDDDNYFDPQCRIDDTRDGFYSSGTLDYRRKGYEKTIEESFPMRVYQKWAIEFYEKTDGKTFCKSYVIEGWKKGFPTVDDSVEEVYLGTEGVVHETARFVYKFIREMQENFVEEVSIDTPFWSQRYDLPNFPHLKKLSICHHRREATEWWMKRFKTMKPILEIELKANRNESSNINKGFANWRQQNTFKNSEACEYILPVKGFTGELVHYAEHPIFWARKLTSTSCIQMRLRDIQHMFCLSELTTNMTQLQATEVNEFLHMWNAGVLGHRLVRVTIQLDYPDRFVYSAKKEGRYVHPAFEDFADNDYLEIKAKDAEEMPEDLKNCLVRPGYITFVLFRNWTQPDGIKEYPETVRDVSPPSEQAQSALQPIPENNVAGSSTQNGIGSESGYDSHVTNSGDNSRTHSLSTDNGYDLEQYRRGALCYKPTQKTDTVRVEKKKELTWIGGSCAVIQFERSAKFRKVESRDAFQSSFHFTAVRNPEFAEILLKLRK